MLNLHTLLVKEKAIQNFSYSDVSLDFGSLSQCGRGFVSKTTLCILNMLTLGLCNCVFNH
ncbi:hypothetical protein IC582_021188 [Cucumis melo]